MKTSRHGAIVLAAVGTLAAGASLAQSAMTFGGSTADTTVLYAAPVVTAPATVQIVTPARTYIDGVPQDIYYDETGRRYEAVAHPRVMRLQTVDLTGPHWVVVDPNNGGATPAEVSQLTGNVDSSTSGMPFSGSGVQPGNMGPANAKGQ